MFKFLKSPDVPSSSPDTMTFPFEFSTLQFSMENFVKSYTRKRVTKENLAEVMEEVNTALKPDWESFKLWDYIAVFGMTLITIGIFYCILTIQMRHLLLFAIKMISVLVGIIVNASIWACCMSSSLNKIRDKIQGILDNRDEFYDEKGMRWTICEGSDFPYWLELHIQSQFEMKLEQEKEAYESKRAATAKDSSFSEDRGMLESNIGRNKKGGKKNNNRGMMHYDMQEDEAEYEEDMEDQPVPRPQRNQNGNNGTANGNYGNLVEEEEYDDEIGF